LRRLREIETTICRALAEKGADVATLVAFLVEERAYTPRAAFSVLRF
jgi:hypothetical protein